MSQNNSGVPANRRRKGKLLTTRNVVILGLLVAAEIILSRFLSINAWNIKIGFNFIPIVYAAVIFGPVSGGIVAALGDFLGAILFPIGAYFPGFTLTAFLNGSQFGLFLHKHRGMGWVAGAVLVSQLVLSLLLNTLWISILYGAPYWPTLISRLPQCGILTVVQFILVPLIVRSSSAVVKEVRV